MLGLKQIFQQALMSKIHIMSIIFMKWELLILLLVEMVEIQKKGIFNLLLIVLLVMELE